MELEPSRGSLPVLGNCLQCTSRSRFWLWLSG